MSSAESLSLDATYKSTYYDVQPGLRFWQNEPKVPPFRAIPELGNAVSRESVLSRAERATLGG